MENEFFSYLSRAERSVRYLDTRDLSWNAESGVGVTRIMFLRVRGYKS